MFEDVNEQISVEVRMYVGYCELASRHDELEEYYRSLAHRVFYHIQELRSTGKVSLMSGAANA